MRRAASILVAMALVVAACGSSDTADTTTTTAPQEETTTTQADTTTTTVAAETTTTTTEPEEEEPAGPSDCPFAPRANIGILNLPFQGIEYDGDDRARCEFYQRTESDPNVLSFTALRGDAVATAYDDWLAEIGIDPAEIPSWSVNSLTIAGGEGYILTHSADGNLSALGFRDGNAAIATMAYRERVVAQGRPDNVFRNWVELVLGHLAAGNWQAD